MCRKFLITFENSDSLLLAKDEEKDEEQDEEQDSSDNREAQDNLVRGEYFQIQSATADHPEPLLQISPILGATMDNYLATRIFGGWANKVGFSYFFLYQEEILLAPERSAADLERLLLKTTRENIQGLHLLAARPEIDESRLGSFGISMGAIKNVLIAAVEPRLKGSILCLAGGNFARILRNSRENMVLNYFRDRKKHNGWTREQIIEDFEKNLQTDPILVAPYVDPKKVFMFLGSLDDKVPYATGLHLHQQLGQPELHVFPVGHYTAMVTAPLAARLGFDWLREKFEGGGETETVVGTDNQ